MTVRVILVIALCFHTMVNITRPLITLYASDLGASTLEVGLLTAAYAILPLAFAIQAGKLADLVGDRLPILLGSLGAALGLSLPYLFPSIASLYLSQGLVGISHVLITISLQNVLGHAATKQTRDQVFGIFSMFVAIGSFAGPVIGGYIADHISYPFAFLVSVFIGVLPVALAFLVPVIQMRVKDAQSEGAVQEHAGSPLQLLRIPLLRKALASSALVLYSRDIFVAYFPLYAAGLGISASAIGWIIAVQGLAMVVVRLLLGTMTVRFGRDRVLLASIMLAGLAFLLVPFAGTTYMFGLLSAMMGLGLGCGQPLSMSTTYNASPKTRTGEVLGLRLASNRLSQLLAPMFFGLVGSSAGLLSVFYVSGAFLLGGALLTRSKATEKSQEA
ncbi:MFS transporter [Paenibacillus filicis]|uniref:MFS transporter n=1 Tax=Paenibacillus filicis TaxID=669464 RepID=A0ABU9DBT5_9BACL